MFHIRFISDIVSVLCLISLWCIVLTWVFLFVCFCLFLVFAWLHFYCMLNTVKKSGYWDNKIYSWKIAQPLFWLGWLWGAFSQCSNSSVLSFVVATSSPPQASHSSSGILLFVVEDLKHQKTLLVFLFHPKPLADPAYLSCGQSLCSWPIPMVDCCFCFVVVVVYLLTARLRWMPAYS